MEYKISTDPWLTCKCSPLSKFRWTNIVFIWIRFGYNLSYSLFSSPKSHNWQYHYSIHPQVIRKYLYHSKSPKSHCLFNNVYLYDKKLHFKRNLGEWSKRTKALLPPSAKSLPPPQPKSCSFFVINFFFRWIYIFSHLGVYGFV